MSNARPRNAIKSNTYSGKELTGFLIGLAGQNIIYNIIASGLQFYMQSIIYLPAIAISVIFAAARVWDAVNDPMMGSIVDKTRTKWGKCKPYLMFIPPVVCLVTILTFVNGIYTNATSTWQKALIIGWAGVSYILWGMTYTVGDIPLWGVTSLMTEDQNDRAKALSLARIVASVGVIGMATTYLAQGLEGVFAGREGVDTAHARQYAYILAVAILTIFASILFEIAGLSVKERVSQSNETYTLKENFQTMFRCRPFRQLLISGILRSPIQLLSIISITLVTYYYFNGNIMNVMTEDGLNVSLLISLLVLGVGIFGGMLIGSAVTPKLVSKFEKKTLYNFYCFIGAIPFALVFVFFLLSGGDLTSMVWTLITGVTFFLASWAQGGLNVLQSVMIADCVDYEEYTRGVRPDGVFFSGQSFITKLSAGIASLISGAVYAIVGFSEGNVEALDNALSQGASFLTYNGGKFAMAMFFLVSIPPAIGMILSALPTLKYSLTDKEHTRILDELNAKRNAQ